jgi:hypothetical protein
MLNQLVQVMAFLKLNLSAVQPKRMALLRMNQLTMDMAPQMLSLSILAMEVLVMNPLMLGTGLPALNLPTPIMALHRQNLWAPVMEVQEMNQ